MLAGLEGPEEGLLGANEAVDEEVEAGVEDEEEMGDGRGNVHPPGETGGSTFGLWAELHPKIPRLLPGQKRFWVRFWLHPQKWG